jgi:NAD(P)-dependent dehydrogenase (short-subunit alcohol dehydrogenase family)
MAGIEGLTALVTGGGSGIGLGTAKRFAAEGAHVTICGRTESRLLHALEEIRAAAAPGATLQSVVADVTVEEQVTVALETAAHPTGTLDIVFANAGGSAHMGPIDTAELGAVRSTVELNVLGTFLCIKHAVPLMTRTGGGSIVGMSSGAGHFPHRYLWAYGTAKAGVEMLCRYAAEELGDRNIRVNAVRPGIVDDELMAPITAGGALLEDYLEQMPIRRLGTVEDIASAVRFLAGPESSWITGTCLAVDGGHHLRRGANYQTLFGV